MTHTIVIPPTSSPVEAYRIVLSSPSPPASPEDHPDIHITRVADGWEVRVHSCGFSDPCVTITISDDLDHPRVHVCAFPTVPVTPDSNP